MTTLTFEEIEALDQISYSVGESLAGLTREELSWVANLPASERVAGVVMLSRGLGAVGAYNNDVFAGIKVLLGGSGYIPKSIDSLLTLDGVLELKRIGQDSRFVTPDSDDRAGQVTSLWLASDLPVEDLNSLTPEQRRAVYTLAGGGLRKWDGDTKSLLTLANISEATDVVLGLEEVGALAAAGVAREEISSLTRGELGAAERIAYYTRIAGREASGPDLVRLAVTAHAARRSAADYDSHDLDVFAYAGVGALLQAGVPPERIELLDFAELAAANYTAQNSGTGLKGLVETVGLENLQTSLRKIAEVPFAKGTNLAEMGLYRGDNLGQAIAAAYSRYEWGALRAGISGAGRLVACGFPVEAATSMSLQALSAAEGLGEGRDNALQAFVDAWGVDGFAGRAVELPRGGGELQGLSYLVASGVEIEIAVKLSRTALDRAYRIAPGMYAGLENPRSLPRTLPELEEVLSSLPETMGGAFGVASALTGGLTRQEADEFAADNSRFPLHPSAFEVMPEGVSRRRVTKAVLATRNPRATGRLIECGVSPEIVVGVTPPSLGTSKAKVMEQGKKV